MKRTIFRFIAALIFLACFPEKPSSAPLSEGIDEDSERRLWVRAKEETERLDRSGFLYQDPELEAYINAVAGKLPNTGQISIRVKVIKNPYLNAIAYPDGAIYIHSGILASMENEAQLAHLLGHEIVHARDRHLAQEFTKKKKRSESKVNLASWLGTFGEALGQLSILAAVNGYSRELESEADREGLKMAVQAGYDPREAVRLHELFREEIVRENKKIPFIYSTHPKIEDRIRSYEMLIAELYREKTGVTNAEAFGRRTTRVLLDNAELDLKLGNTDIARQRVEKYIHRKPDDAKAYFLLGEIHRESGANDREQEAIVQYRKALSLRPNYPDPHRALGMMAYKKGDKTESKKYFSRYLALQPSAADKEYILQYINQ